MIRANLPVASVSVFFFFSLSLCRFTLTYQELILLFLSFNKLLSKRWDTLPGAHITSPSRGPPPSADTVRETDSLPSLCSFFSAASIVVELSAATTRIVPIFLFMLGKTQKRTFLMYSVGLGFYHPSLSSQLLQSVAAGLLLSQKSNWNRISVQLAQIEALGYIYSGRLLKLWLLQSKRNLLHYHKFNSLFTFCCPSV